MLILVTGVLLETIDAQVASSLSHHVDVGVETSLVASSSRDQRDLALGVDFVLGVYREHRYPPHTRMRDRLRDLASGGTVTQRWPTFARPRFELHLGGSLDLDGDRGQARLAIGTGLGPLGLGLGGIVDHATATTFGVSPELRLRHRAGPQAQSPSWGAFVRADVLVGEADRLAIGVFGMFDVY